MTRRRLGQLKHVSESLKRPIIQRRRNGLFKKAFELSTLCDVEVGMVIYNPTKREPIVWPSMEATADKFSRFMSLPPSEKLKKFVTHEQYLREKISDDMEKIKKKEQEIKDKELSLIMYEVIVNGKNIDEFEPSLATTIYTLSVEKMRELERRRRFLEREQSEAATGDGSLVQLIMHYQLAAMYGGGLGFGFGDSSTDGLRTSSLNQGAPFANGEGGSHGGPVDHRMLTGMGFTSSTSLLNQGAPFTGAGAEGGRHGGSVDQRMLTGTTLFFRTPLLNQGAQFVGVGGGDCSYNVPAPLAAAWKTEEVILSPPLPPPAALDDSDWFLPAAAHGGGEGFIDPGESSSTAVNTNGVGWDVNDCYRPSFANDDVGQADWPYNS